MKLRGYNDSLRMNTESFQAELIQFASLTHSEVLVRTQNFMTYELSGSN
jgi:hypothetical protein